MYYVYGKWKIMVRWKYQSLQSIVTLEYCISLIQGGPKHPDNFSNLHNSSLNFQDTDFSFSFILSNSTVLFTYWKFSFFLQGWIRNCKGSVIRQKRKTFKAWILLGVLFGDFYLSNFKFNSLCINCQNNWHSDATTVFEYVLAE